MAKQKEEKEQEGAVETGPDVRAVTTTLDVADVTIQPNDQDSKNQGSEPQVEAVKSSGKEVFMTRDAFDALPADAVDTNSGGLILKETGDSIRLI